MKVADFMGISKKTHKMFLLFLVCSMLLFVIYELLKKISYLGNGLIWFWLAVVITLLIFLVSLILIGATFTKKYRTYYSLAIGISSGVLLIISALWTTFIIVSSLSGIG
ncbi:hypothetical protein ACWN8B_08045 [Vagococcus zengguangii]|uniref:Uncharacterized protein n=1 Tax=Vagococcus zengguangii TaxID=2571750 RepID=A0A4D7CRD2_9ENTE|nr:hypothetical protein FA707_06380 [Vagococcus zengguangii]